MSSTLSFPLDADITPFLKKLLSLTSTVSSDIAGWDSKGSVFIVKDGKAFEGLLRNYFKGTLQTFIRQLHFYGFSKSDLPRIGPHAWSFSHPRFLRDSPNLVVGIRRKSNGFSPCLSPQSKNMSLKRMGSFKMNKIESNRADDVQKIQEELKDLKERVKSLQDTTEQLMGIVTENLMEENAKKKRKISTTDNAFDISIASTLPTDTTSVIPTRSKLKHFSSSFTQEFFKDLANGFPDEKTETVKTSKNSPM